ncbi:helix-turn-helix domain-containing protein [Microaerobacter geothermalis]|uniref:helix-turn-helix transcriptional regulator n=1 Tax=Microaerobacter geothermalis TaxID=674972 RepID=UPI001F412A2D|nr:helix-turn-helix domain-containing protein [Microaerobacter geothermalis]MCF6093566.1 helix-turn-helix domain-containing protein [Microaerobacter geothermalis]
MENETLRITSVLADPTRFSIYQYVASSHRTVTVQEIAEEFNIHPNVARLHLSKLEDIELLKSESEKTGKGGRPSRLYSLSDQVISLQFSPRDYQLLAQIAIESLLSLGEAGQKALKEMGKRFGIEASKQALAKEKQRPEDMTVDQALASIERLVLAQGLYPEFERIDESTIRFRIHNCTFKETALQYPQSICSMHHSLLEGIFETYFGQLDFIKQDSIMTNCSTCEYTIVRLPVK